MNRRQFAMQTGAAIFGPRLLKFPGIDNLAAQSASAQSFDHSYGDGLPDMLVSYLTGRINNLAATWDRKRAMIETVADLQVRNTFVRETFFEMLHPFPPRNPLNAITVKTLERDGYRIENVMFQSRPDFWVTGNLYIPSGKGPFPGIISPCGHYPLARMAPTYQTVYLNLVKSGFVVLGYDPIGQGERRQYWNPQTDVTEVAESPVYEHSMPGQLLLLLGENLTQYMVWEGMRAIDYLLTRPEVDGKKIGCAGHSGGGTLTKFISLADQRVQCATIIEGGTANHWPLVLDPWQPLGPADVEQNLFPSAIYGIDYADMQIGIAPRPLLAAIEHLSPAFNDSVDMIKARYRQLGVPERFTAIASDDPHAWTMKLRVATVNWFSRWFYDREGPDRFTVQETEPPQKLYCTPIGSIRHSQRGETIFTLIGKKQATLPLERRVPGTAEELTAYQEEMRAKIGTLLRYHKSDQPLNPRHVAATPHEGYRIDKMEILAEEGIYLPTWVFVPDNASVPLPVILYVPDDGIEDDGMEFAEEESSGLRRGVLDTMARRGNLVVAVDVRGRGETRPRHQHETSEQFGQLFDVEAAMSYLAWFMDQSLFAMRVQDVVRSVDYIASRQDADSEHLHVIGKGNGGLWCLYAAALDSRIRSLICVHSLLSYRTLTSVDRYLYGADVFIPDVLNHFDLPQVAAAMANRPLALISPTDAMKNIVTINQARETYHWTQGVYNYAGAASLLRIESGGPDREYPEHYLQVMADFKSSAR